MAQVRGVVLGDGGPCGEQEEMLKYWAMRRTTQASVTAFLTEAQKGRRKSGAGTRGVLLPFLPSPSPF